MARSNGSSEHWPTTLLLAAVLLMSATGGAQAACANMAGVTANMNRAAQALNTAKAEGTQGAGLGGLQSNVQAAQYNYDVAVAAYNACLRLAGSGGYQVGAENGGGNRVSQALGRTADTMGMIGNMAAMLEEQQEADAARAQREEEEEAARANQAAAAKQAAAALDASQRAAMPNPFGAAEASSPTDNPFAQPSAEQGTQAGGFGGEDQRAYLTQESIACNYGRGDQTACQIVAKAAAAEVARSTATAPNWSPVQQNINTLNQMGNGGDSVASSNLKGAMWDWNVAHGLNPDGSPGSFSSPVAEAGGNPFSSARDPSADEAPGGDRNPANTNAVAPSQQPSGLGGSGLGPSVAAAGTHGLQVSTSNDPDQNPFAPQATAQPLSGLGDPHDADLPGRLDLSPAECAAQLGDVVTIPGAKYCVIGSAWHHLSGVAALPSK